MEKILIIDDEKLLRELFSGFLKKKGYATVTAADGFEGLQVYRSENPDLILTDLNMPGMTGLDVIKNVRTENKNIPIIVISGLRDIQDMMAAIHLGAWDYLVKPVDNLQVIEHSVSRSIERSHLIEENKKFSENLENEVRFRTEFYQNELQMRVAAESLLRQSLDNLTRVTDQVINAISRISDIRDPYTGGHQRRVAHLARAIAERLNLDNDLAKGIYIGSLLHDIGKVSIPLEILSKPGSITPIEREIIKTHPRVSSEILKGIEFPWPIYQMALQHHERLDGSGYPEGLAGDDILHESRIIMVADVVESISSHRPYRPSLGIEAAIQEIKENAGILYDREVTECCIGLLKEGFSFPA